MLSIARNELLKNLKSIKSILVILIFAALSFLVSKALKGFMNGNLEGLYSTLKILVFILGYLFVSIISHDAINREVEMQTIRLIITKISKRKFIIGKFIGILFFWIICILISFTIISISAKTFNIVNFSLLISCIFYYIGVTIFLSTIIDRTTISNFLGLFISIVLPAGGLYITTTTNVFKFLKWIFPYAYIEFSQKNNLYIAGPIVIGMIFLIVSLIILDKKDV